ncbi:MAG: polysaccharide pyruvyl transferase family protein [Prosthecobacter sp.]
MKKVCVISTLNHNVGDDFVRAGILSLLHEVLGEIEVQTIHKHFPATVRGGIWTRIDTLTRGLSDRFSWRTRLSRIADRLPMHPRTDLALSSDLIVQSGAPVYWLNNYSKCAHTEWFRPVIERRWLRLKERVPLLNLGAGSCQSWGSLGVEISEDTECRTYIDQFTRWCSLTTVRDALAQRIVRECGHEVPLLPCPSIFAPDATGVQPKDGEYVALNYMPNGGHYELDGRSAELGRRWEKVFCEEARLLAGQQRCLMICHDQKELEQAAHLLPDIPRFFSTEWQDYLDAYSRCCFAVVNRVHGAVVTAAMGKSVLLTGNDSRLLTAAEVPGITVLPVPEAVTSLRTEVQGLSARTRIVCPRSFIEETREKYLSLLRPILRP